MIGGGAALVAVAVVIGVVLAGVHLMELPAFPRWATRAALAHGAAGALGTALLATAVLAAPAAAFTRLATLTLAATLAGGALILAAHVRRRRVPTLLIGLHATAGIAGAVLLAAGLGTGQ